MAFGKPNGYGQGFGQKNLVDRLKWRDCAVRIPDSNPADGFESPSRRSRDRATKAKESLLQRHLPVPPYAFTVPPPNIFVLLPPVTHQVAADSNICPARIASHEMASTDVE